MLSPPPDIRTRLATLLGPGYRIDRELYGGGMSRLFIAEDVKLGREVVVKVLPPDLLSTISLARFRREIELTVKLQHPHILPILAAGGDGDVHYYVAPFVQGESLRELLERRRMLGVAETRRILLQVAEALAFAHSRGVVHRDIKPGNILLLENQVILADFGIARAVAGVESLTRTSTALGTPAYMAPERPQDEPADLYGVAAVGYEMLTGERLSGPPSIREMRRARGDAEARSTEFDWLAEVLCRALAVDPARRYQTADELVAALTERPGVMHRMRERWPTLTLVAVAALTVFGYAAYGGSAKRAEADARRALERDDLRGALAAARRAVAADSNSLTGMLTIARVALLEGSDSLASAGSEAALRALAAGREGRAPLDHADSLFAEGVTALLRDQPAAACTIFDRLVTERPRAFDGWFGAGECRRRDALVIPDSTRPGQHVFRSSLEHAARAYESARHFAGPHPPSVLFRRLGQVLFTEPNRLRTGTSARGGVWRAYPELRADTLAFFPMEILPGRMVPIPAGRGRTLEANMVRLRRSYAEWTRTVPSSPHAHRAFAEVLESMGVITERGAEETSALEEIRTARRLSGDTLPDLLGIQVRLLLREGDFPAARALGDSLLRRWPATDLAREIELLPGIAAVLGRVHLVTAYGRELSATPRSIPVAEGRPIPLPPELRRMRADLLSLSAMGVCDARIGDLASRLSRAVTVDYPEFRGRRVVQLAILDRPLSLALPCLGPPASTEFLAGSENLLARAAQDLVRGGRTRLRATLDSVARFRRLARPGDLTLEYVYGEASLLVAAGDTAEALLRIDRGLGALPSLPSSAFSEVPIAAAMVRAMALGARLARARGDHRLARRWAGAVVTLWSAADPDLQDVVAEMRGLLGSYSLNLDTSRADRALGARAR